MKLRNGHSNSAKAFTLIEVLMAIAIFAIVLTAINTVFFAGMRLREKTTDMLEDSLPTDRAVTVMKRDLMGIMPPGVLPGVMSSDTSSPGIMQMVALEIYTTTGLVGPGAPWGDVQKVDYSLQYPSNATGHAGQDLVRSVTRNLLASDTQTPASEALLNNVESLKFSYYDGTNWNDSWSATLSNIPTAIRVAIEFANAPTDKTVRVPIQITVPVVMQALTNSTSTNSSN